MPALAQVRHALAAQTQDAGPAGVPAGTLSSAGAAQDRHLDLVAERQPGERERQLADQIGAVADEDLVRADVDTT